MSSRVEPGQTPDPNLQNQIEDYVESKIEETIQTDEETIKDYLGDTLIPLLAYGLEELEKTRPPDPVIFLAHFLLRHNPRKSYQ